MLTLEKKTFDLEGQKEFFWNNENLDWVSVPFNSFDH